MSQEVIIALSGAAAAVITSIALVIKAWRKVPPSRDSALPPAPRQAASRHETSDARFARLEERMTACESAARGVQEDLDEMREYAHTIEKGAIERQGQTNERIAELVGARSTRGSRGRQ